MPKYLLSFVLLFAIGLFVSCNRAEPLQTPFLDYSGNTSLMTKAYGDKTPKMAVYVETNDVNPVNAIDYYLEDGENFFDIVELFASNIHVDGYGDPCLYFNPELAPVMANKATFIEPLQNAGIKVVLSVLGDWQDMGLCTLTDAQAQMLAEILAYVVNEYELDGIGLNDEYEGYNYNTVAGSFGNLILKLRTLLPENKLITCFQSGHYSQIGTTAGCCLDYVYTNFTYYVLNSACSISGVTNSHWAPMAMNLGYSYSNFARNYLKINAGTTADNGYGAIMFFNLLRADDVNPVPVLTAIAEGAYGQGVYVSGGNRPRATATSGVTITYDDI